MVGGLVLAPLALGALAFFGAIVAVALAEVLEVEAEDGFIAKVALSFAALSGAALVLLLRPHAFWTVRLGPNAVLFGRGLLSRRLRYGEIRLIRAGTPHLPKELTGEPAAVVLLVDGGWPKRYRIRLRPRDANACLRALHARCGHALAIDTRGREWLPKDAASAAVARRTLARYWTGWGALMAVGGCVLTLACVAAIAAVLLGWASPGARLRRVTPGLVLGPACAIFGWRLLERGRRWYLTISDIETSAAGEP